MDPATFHAEINKIVTGHRLDQHPYVKLVNEGSAAREQLKGYPIQHYEMTVRDSAPLSAAAYLKMYGLRPALAEPGIQIEPPLAHRARQPSPMSRLRVSCSGRPTTPV